MRRPAPGFPIFLTARHLRARNRKELIDIYLTVMGARTSMSDERIRESLLETQLQLVAGVRGWNGAAIRSAMPEGTGSAHWYTKNYDNHNKPKRDLSCRCPSCKPYSTYGTGRMQPLLHGTAGMRVRRYGTEGMTRRVRGRFGRAPRSAGRTL